MDWYKIETALIGLNRLATLLLAAITMATTAAMAAVPQPTPLIEGGALDEQARRALYFATDARPATSAASTVLLPDPIETPEGPLRRAVTWSDVYDIERLYNSMQGPNSSVTVDLSTGAPPELLWVKGVFTEVVDEEGAPVSQEFMCHVVGALENMNERNAALGLPLTQSNGLPRDARFATLSQGVYHKQYPRGFGLPILSNHLLEFTSQMLNLNAPDADLRIRHKIVTQYVRDRDRTQPIKAITSTYANVMMLVDGDEGDGYFGVRSPETETHGASCSVGQKADSELGLMSDGRRKFTAHWILPPGESVDETLATELMDVQYDTKIHSIDVHLHPFAKWIELRDLTSGETVFRSEAHPVDQGIGLARVQTLQSEDGLPVHADHQYAIVSAYDNSSGKPQDAMAVMYFGLFDPDFDPRLIEDSSARDSRQASYRQRNVAQLRRAVLEDGQDPVAHALLALALFQQRDLAGAAQHLRTAIRLNPQDQSYRDALGAVERALGSQETAP